MHRSRLVGIGLGIIAEGVAMMLPPAVGIPLIIIGFLVILWSLIPNAYANLARKLPAPLGNRVYQFLTDIEYITDKSIANEALPPISIKVRLDGGLYAILDSNMISSLDDVGSGELSLNFTTDVNNQNSIVRVDTDTRTVDYEVVEKSPTALRLKFNAHEPTIMKITLED